MQGRMLELAGSGMACSQIMMQMILEWQGMENADLVRAMGGLTRGMGRCGRACGALTAGCCILGLFTEKGDMQEEPHPQGQALIAEYVEWFSQHVGAPYGGCDCENIVGGDFSKSMRVCLPIVQDCLEHLMGILMDEGIVE